MKAGWDQRFPLARSAAHLGKLACASGDAVARIARAGRLGVR